MASTTKIQNPKSQSGAPPRLMPRPTAASAARAALNARSLQLATTKPPTLPKVKSYISASRSNISKTDSKLEFKSYPKPGTGADTNHEIVRSSSEVNIPVSTTISIQSTKDGNYQTPEELCSNTSNETGNMNEQQAGGLHESVEKHETPTVIQQYVEETVPKHRSPPQTPNSKQSSRPPTPRSWPATPSRQLPSSRPSSGPDSRLNSAFSSGPSMPQSPKTSNSIHSAQRSPRSRIPAPSTRQQIPQEHEEDAPYQEQQDLQMEYTIKEKQFYGLKKDLDLKQHALLQLFDNLRSLNERMSQDGKGACGETLPVQDLVVVNVGDWTTHEVAQLYREALASPDADDAVEIIKNTSSSINEERALDEKADILTLPTQFADLCIQAFTARQELIDWVKELVCKIGGENSEYLDRIAHYNNQGIELCETLRSLKTRADEVLDIIIRISRRACKERSALMSVGESLVREVTQLRHDFEAREAIVNEIQEMRVEKETMKLLEEANRALEEERANSHAMKEKLGSAEAQQRQTRARVAKMERQLREAETTITSLNASVKTLEEQSRQREIQLEARTKKLKESVKTSEVTSSQLVQQRNELQAQIQSLKEQIQQLTEQNKSTSEHIKEVKELRKIVKEIEQETTNERNLRVQLENELQEREALIEQLKTKNNTTKPSSDMPTDREMDLWAELQATKDSLRMAEEEMTACKREKARFLETLTKISDSENQFGLQKKLAAELLSKEEIINKMQTQIRELTKNFRFNEQKMIQYEQYVHDLQERTRVVADCREAPNGISYQDLQQEIMTLRMKLLDSEHRNSELGDILAQKELQLDQQDKTSRAQARVIKVREELINMLKTKEAEQSRELHALHQDCEQRMKVVDDVNKQIASKAEEIQELFATLEGKQQQIHRLEKIVLALEEQQRRAQAQRTRHEEKIATLEHQIAAGERRDRKFLFF